MTLWEVSKKTVCFGTISDLKNDPKSRKFWSPFWPDFDQMDKKPKVERVDKLILIWLWQKEKRYILLHVTCFDLLNQLETDHDFFWGEKNKNQVLINQLETGGGGQIFWKDKKIKIFIEIAETLTGSGFKRCRGTESNRRHEDFQSSALPTELPRQPFSHTN